MWEFERSLAGTARRIAGVDEAGRGALAGPVVAAAVVLSDNPAEWADIDDSKKLSRAKRQRLYEKIRANALAVGVGIATAEEIDVYNILHASRIAMGRAIAELEDAASLVLVDGTYSPIYEDKELPSVPVVDGDALCLSIAAASIVAKVERDTLMERLSEQYPHYGFEQNAGYGTAQHLQALAEYGPADIHRRSFGPVQRFLQVRLDI